MRTSERNFLLAAAGAAMALLGGFAAVIATLLFAFPPQPFVNYRLFLLETVPGPRIVFDGGSSALYAINAPIIEKHYGTPTIVIADHAGIPIEAKLTRIRRYAQPGDTFILPLEWPHYVRDYTEPVLTRHGYWYFRHYLDAMPVMERLSFAMTNTRPHDAFIELVMRAHDRHPPLAERIADFRRRLSENAHGAYFDRPRRDFAGLQGFTCSQYIFLRRSEIIPGLSRIAADMASIAREKGIKIMIAWPAVAGPECYSDRARVDRMAGTVRAAFEQAGIPVIGTPYRSSFPDDGYRYDTFYHLTAAGAEIRTRRLIEDIDTTGLLKPNDQPRKTTPEYVAEALDAARHP